MNYNLWIFVFSIAKLSESGIVDSIQITDIYTLIIDTIIEGVYVLNRNIIFAKTIILCDMEELIKLDSVDTYNKLFGLETLHPMVSVIDLSKATIWPEHFKINYGVYALFLKDTKCGDITYGRQPYDYKEGTIVCFAPGQVAATEVLNGIKPMAHGVLFHPDFIRGTILGQEIKNILSSHTKLVRLSIYLKTNVIPSWIVYIKLKLNWNII